MSDLFSRSSGSHISLLSGYSWIISLTKIWVNDDNRRHKITYIELHWRRLLLTHAVNSRWTYSKLIKFTLISCSQTENSKLPISEVINSEFIFKLRLCWTEFLVTEQVCCAATFGKLIYVLKSRSFNVFSQSTLSIRMYVQTTVPWMIKTNALLLTVGRLFPNQTNFLLLLAGNSVSTIETCQRSLLFQDWRQLEIYTENRSCDCTVC